MSRRPFTRIVGIYDADGGPIGEARYVLGTLLGTSHCALCDVTHSPVRRKPAWDSMVERLDLPVSLLHRNQLPDSLRPLAQEHGLPLVIGLTGRQAEVLLTPAELDGLGGSVAAFDRQVRRAMAQESEACGATAGSGRWPAPDGAARHRASQR